MWSVQVWLVYEVFEIDWFQVNSLLVSHVVVVDLSALPLVHTRVPNLQDRITEIRIADKTLFLGSDLVLRTLNSFYDRRYCMSLELRAASTARQGGGVSPGITSWRGWLLLPELLCFLQYLRALHPQQEEHGHYRQQCRHCVCDDVRKRVVIRNEKNVKHGGGREVASQQAARIRQHRHRVYDGQAEEGNSPHAMEYLQ